MTRRILPAVIALLLPTAALAADWFVPMSRYGETSQMVAVGWEPAMPLPELYERMEGRRSFAGASAEARFGFARGLTAGAALNWNEFSTPANHARAARFEAYSVRATMHYYPFSGIVEPYVGLGVGGVRRSYTVESAGIAQTGWGWAVDPQFGVLVTVDQGLAFNILAHYQITNAWLTPDVPGRQTVENPSWVGITVGIALY